MNRITIVVILLTIFISCGTRSNAPIPSDEEEQVSQKEALAAKHASMGFFTTDIQTDSSFVCLYVNSESNNLYFYSDTLNRLYASKYQMDGKNIGKTKTDLLLQNNWTYLSIDTTSFIQLKIEDTPYLYFSTEENYMGSAVIDHTVNFHLLNLNDLTHYQLPYVGRYSFKCEECIDGNYVPAPALLKKPTILAKLKELSRSSKKIYQRTAKDNDSYHYKNYETKWNKDNKANNAYGAGYSEIYPPIRTTYYATDLFALYGDVTENMIENDRFKFVAYFRGNILGYDKERKLYFPFLIESCVSFCNKDISFSEDSDSIIITYSEGNETNYSIAMDEILFDTKIGD